MSTEKNIILQQFNGRDYDILYPKTLAEQVEGIYRKDEVLSNATKAIYGLGADAVPDNAFAILGPYTQYWWLKKGPEYYASYGENKIRLIDWKTDSPGSRGIQYSESINIKEDLTIELANPISTITLGYRNPEDAIILKGKYFTGAYDGKTNIQYMQPDADDPYAEYSSPSYMLKGTFALVVGNKRFSNVLVHSSDRNAYPDSGIVDGAEYVFLGKPLDNAISAAKIKTGSYVGTGTYGKDNPCSLTFDSKPQFIIVASSTGSFFVATRGQNQSSTNYGASYYNVVLTWGEQDISWYNTNNAGNQLNNSGITYCYTIIGT